MRARRLSALLAGVLAILALTAGADGFSAGRSDRAAGGCGDGGCHGIGPDTTVTPVLEGLPEKYTPGETYLLTVRVDGAREPVPAVARAAGGFALGASDGALSPAPGDPNVQVGSDLNATHTAEGSLLREWTVVWTAPPPTGGAVVFDLTANGVNGNAAPDPLDQWNTVAFTIEEGTSPAPPPRSGPNVSNQDAASDPFGDEDTPFPGALAVLVAALVAVFVHRKGV